MRIVLPEDIIITTSSPASPVVFDRHISMTHTPTGVTVEGKTDGRYPSWHKLKENMLKDLIKKVNEKWKT